MHSHLVDHMGSCLQTSQSTASIRAHLKKGEEVKGSILIVVWDSALRQPFGFVTCKVKVILGACVNAFSAYFQGCILFFRVKQASRISHGGYMKCSTHPKKKWKDQRIYIGRVREVCTIVIDSTVKYTSFFLLLNMDEVGAHRER